MKSFDKEPEILFCDNHILVANKPAGLLTQPSETDFESLEGSAKAWIKEQFHKPGNVFLHAIHRLDRPVSGLVLFARTSKALTRLNEQSRKMEVQRQYIAEVEGILEHKEGRLDHYLLHGEHRALIGQESQQNAKHARLYYRVLGFGPHTTKVEVDLETGRYHQIRAQFSAIHHPIVGDQRYGSRSAQGHAIHLHCFQLSFSHPVTQEQLSFQIPAPF